MTIDDENSIYVGNLPYEATEATIRTAFDIYGQIIAVKDHSDGEDSMGQPNYSHYGNWRLQFNPLE
ncbi:U1 small nuclear ribonucleoprotein 70 kDa isoform X2, partial [Tanacetum coccineum]